MYEDIKRSACGALNCRSNYMQPSSEPRRSNASANAVRAPESRGVILLGHGSLRSNGGAAMIRLAERAQEAGVASLVEAAFLNYRRPTFQEALARCIAASITEIVVQPYFLVPGTFVRTDVARLVAAEQLAHPDLALRVARPFGDHPALARLLQKRALEADYTAANPNLGLPTALRPIDEGAGWRPLHQQHRTGLLIMAHGSPDASANQPIHALVRQLRAQTRYAAVSDCYLDLNAPTIGAAADAMLAHGIRHMIALPFFLHLGNHVREDLPAQIAAARARHPQATILLAEHLGYDRLLVPVIADRVAEAFRHGAAQPASEAS